MKPESTFVDTNLFLRYLTNDVPAQADAVEGLLRRAAMGQLHLVTNSMVVAEIVWTLESYYRLPRQEIEVKVLAMLNTPGLEVSEAELLVQAIWWYAELNVDFVDAYNTAWLGQHGFHQVYTFDQRHFSRFDGITIKVPSEV